MQVKTAVMSLQAKEPQYCRQPSEAVKDKDTKRWRHSLHAELKDVTVKTDYSPPVCPKGIQEDLDTSVKMQDAGPR